jgi:hypothetical protein
MLGFTVAPASLDICAGSRHLFCPQAGLFDSC